MNLIDLILDNLFFIILALGFITSVLAKKKQEEKSGEASRTGRSTVPYEKVEREPIQRSTEYAYSEPKMKKKGEEGMESSKLKEMNEQMEELKRQQVQKTRLDKEDADSPIYAGDPYASQEDPYARKNATPYEISGEDSYERPHNTPYSLEQRSHRSVFQGQGLRKESIQGMMWSEVYGVPKSKKPHRYRKLGR